MPPNTGDAPHWSYSAPHAATSQAPGPLPECYPNPRLWILCCLMSIHFPVPASMDAPCAPVPVTREPLPPWASQQPRPWCAFISWVPMHPSATLMLHRCLCIRHQCYQHLQEGTHKLDQLQRNPLATASPQGERSGSPQTLCHWRTQQPSPSPFGHLRTPVILGSSDLAEGPAQGLGHWHCPKAGISTPQWGKSISLSKPVHKVWKRWLFHQICKQCNASRNTHKIKK